MNLEFGDHTPAPEPTGYHVLTREEINAIPDLEPMIDGVIDRGTVVMLAAQPAAGKTFIALDWALRYATGTDWQGRTVHPGHKTMYVAAEGARTIKGRLQAWEKAWQIPVPEEQFRMIGRPVNLGSTNEVAMFIHALDVTGPYGLVIIDTVARCSLGLEENSASDMGKVVDSLYRIQEAMGDDGTVIAIHHTGKSGDVRGSSALLGGVDQLMKLEKDGHSLVLGDEKRKDGMELAPMSLQLKAMHGSLVVSGGTPEFEQNNPLVDEMTLIASILPLPLGQLLKAVDLSEKLVYRHLSKGINDGLIRVTEGNNPRYSLSNRG